MEEEVLLVNLRRLYHKTREHLSKGDVSMEVVKMSIETMENLIQESNHGQDIKRMEKQIKTMLKDVELPVEPSILPLPKELKHLSIEKNDMQTLSPDDFIVEEPVQDTGTVRQRFGFENTTDKDEENEVMKTEMVSIAQRLKETTQSIHQQLQDDVTLLDEVEERSSNSLSKITTQTDRLIQQLSDGIGLWTTLLIILAAILSFVAMYILMKIFPKQQ